MSAILRNVYVPAADRRARAKSNQRELVGLPPELATRAAKFVFRGIPWESGKKAEVSVPESGRQERELFHPDASMGARRFYGLLPWDGVREECPKVAAQEKRSVGAILAMFNWEKAQ
jgi:hypothetical protein